MNRATKLRVFLTVVLLAGAFAAGTLVRMPVAEQASAVVWDDLPLTQWESVSDLHLGGEYIIEFTVDDVIYDNGHVWVAATTPDGQNIGVYWYTDESNMLIAGQTYRYRVLLSDFFQGALPIFAIVN